jgi:hypothetical protein
MDEVILPPFDLGFDMFQRTFAREDNPFDSGTGDHDHWDQGWCEARDEHDVLMDILLDEEEEPDYYEPDCTRCGDGGCPSCDPGFFF